MELVRYRTSEPLEHLPRALDILRRMGFDLDSTEVVNGGRDEWHVRIRYQVRGHLSADTFVERVRQIPGVRDVSGLAAEESLVTAAFGE